MVVSLLWRTEFWRPNRTMKSVTYHQLCDILHNERKAIISLWTGKGKEFIFFTFFVNVFLCFVRLICLGADAFVRVSHCDRVECLMMLFHVRFRPSLWHENYSSSLFNVWEWCDFWCNFFGLHFIISS